MAGVSIQMVPGQRDEGIQVQGQTSKVWSLGQGKRLVVNG